MSETHIHDDGSSPDPGGKALRFQWLEAGRLPLQFDLRRCGWAMRDDAELSGDCIGLIHVSAHDALAWSRIRAIRPELRRFILVIGVSAPAERAQLLEEGFGEAVTDAIAIEELGARARRLAELTRWLPRYRRLGEIELDLLAREAYGRGKALNLNPREFALIWRLADTPGRPVSKQTLIHDVWRMGFVPETNSIAVHMSRLRRKLGFVGLSGMLATASAGGYCLTLVPASAIDGRGGHAKLPIARHASASHAAI